MDEQWLAVPYRIKNLYVKYAGEMRQLMEDFPENEDAWVIDTPEVGILKQADASIADALAKAWAAAKAGARSTTPLRPLARTSASLQSLLGGPNPLTSALLYGTLGAGLGWGTGKLMHMLYPEKIKKDVSWRLGMPLGAILGGVGALGLHGLPNVLQKGPTGFFHPSPIQEQKLACEMPEGMEAIAMEKWASPGFSALPGILDRVERGTGLMYDKDNAAIQAARAGQDYLPDIDVPYWLDVVKSDPIMSPPTKAIVGGLPMGAAVAKGSRWVSPMDVTRVAANAGLGGMVGSVIGRVAGPVLRLTPEARNDIQRAGMLAGVFKTFGMM